MANTDGRYDELAHAGSVVAADGQRLSPEALESQAAARMELLRCGHRVLQEIDGVEGWYRCQNPDCGWIFEFPVTMKAHTVSDLRRMMGWFERELARWGDGLPAASAPEGQA